MVVTLPVILDGFQDHGKKKDAEQGWNDDGINHGASLKGCFRFSSLPTLFVCQWRDCYMAWRRSASIPQVMEASAIITP